MRIPIRSAAALALIALAAANTACSTDVTFYRPGSDEVTPPSASQPTPEPTPVGCDVDDWSGTFQVGRGYSCFAEVSDGEPLEVEPGPQGGGHYWMAVRCRGCGARLVIDYGILSEDSGEPVYALTVQVADLRTNGDYLQAAGLQAVVTNVLGDTLPAGRFVFYGAVTIDGERYEDRAAFTPLGVNQQAPAPAPSP